MKLTLRVFEYGGSGVEVSANCWKCTFSLWPPRWKKTCLTFPAAQICARWGR